MAHSLRLIEHDLPTGGDVSLPAAVRVRFAATGKAAVTYAGSSAHPLDAEHAWHGTGACAVTTASGARLLRGTRETSSSITCCLRSIPTSER